MDRESADTWVDIQPEFQNRRVEPYSHVSNCDDGHFTTGLNETTLTESSPFVNLSKKMKKKAKRRPRKHKPGNRKRKSHKLRNRSTVTRQIIPRSSLGAPFLCNDMLMAKDGFVFDTCSGKIEFKPEIVFGLPENPSVFDVSGRMSPQNPCQGRYVPISPDHEHLSLDLDCNANVPVIDKNLCHDLNNNKNEEIQSPLQDNAYTSSTLPFEPDTPDTDLFGLNIDLKDEQEISLYFDDEKDFQFHLQNFEEDTERYLRNSLMELSRESLEEEYYSTMRRLRSLQSQKSNVADMLPSSELKDASTSLESNMDLTDQLKQLSQIATSVSSRLEKIQQENTHLKEENCQLKIALDT